MLPALLAMVSARTYAGVNVWTSHGPDGGYVNGPLVIDPRDPKTLYATGGAGILFKSTDAAAHWSPLLRALVLAVDPQNANLVAGTSGGVFENTLADE